VLQQWALDLCAGESRSDVHIQVLINEPLASKREIFTSFALIACNVFF
jgi:hypothetical protein